jgi:hypothetical protein
MGQSDGIRQRKFPNEQLNNGLHRGLKHRLALHKPQIDLVSIPAEAGDF